MQKVKEHIALLKSQLSDIRSQLEPWLNKAAKAEVQSQLSAIVKSSDRLIKTEVNVPAELRELKFKLMKELDKFKEAEILQAELLKILGEYVSIKPQRTIQKQKQRKSHKKHKEVTPQFDLVNLIDAGLLPPNTKLVKKYKGFLHTAILTKDGKIKTNHNNKVVFHSSPSSAAVYLTQKAQNGWTWWIVEGNGNNKTLDFYRQQYLSQNNETRRQRSA